MKEKIHLIYGIIIGILLVACTGSYIEDKAEFKVESVVWVGKQLEANKRIAELKKDGWTIIDFEIVQRDGDYVYFIHYGK